MLKSLFLWYCALVIILGIGKAVEEKNVVWFIYLYRYSFLDVYSHDLKYIIKSIPLIIIMLPYIITVPPIYLILKMVIRFIFNIILLVLVIKDLFTKG